MGYFAESTQKQRDYFSGDGWHTTNDSKSSQTSDKVNTANTTKATNIDKSNSVTDTDSTSRQDDTQQTSQDNNRQSFSITENNADNTLRLQVSSMEDEDSKKAYDNKLSEAFNKTHDMSKAAYNTTDQKDLAQSKDYQNIGVKQQNDYSSAQNLDRQNQEIRAANQAKQQQYEEALAKANEPKARQQKLTQTVEKSTHVQEALDNSESLSNKEQTRQTYDNMYANDAAGAKAANTVMTARDENAKTLTNDSLDDYLSANGLAVADNTYNSKIRQQVMNGEISVEEGLSKLELVQSKPSLLNGLKIYLKTGIKSGATEALSQSNKDFYKQVDTQLAEYMRKGYDFNKAVNAVVKNQVKTNGSVYGDNKGLKIAAEIGASLFAIPAAATGITAAAIGGTGVSGASANVFRFGQKVLKFLGKNASPSNAAKLAKGIETGVTAGSAIAGSTAAGVNAVNDIANANANSDSDSDTSTNTEAPAIDIPEPEYESEIARQEATDSLFNESDLSDIEETYNKLNDESLAPVMTSLSRIKQLDPSSDLYYEAVNSIDKDLTTSYAAIDNLTEENAADYYDFYRKAVSYLNEATTAARDYYASYNDGTGTPIEKAQNILANPRLYSTADVISAQKVIDNTTDISNDNAILRSQSSLNKAVETANIGMLRAAAKTRNTDTMRQALDNAGAISGGQQEAYNRAEQINPDLPDINSSILSAINGMAAKAKDWASHNTVISKLSDARDWANDIYENSKNKLKSVIDKLTPDANTRLGAVLDDIYAVASNLFSPVKASIAAAKTATDSLSLIADIMTTPFTKANKAVDDFTSRVNRWYEKAKAAATGQVDVNDAELASIGLNTRTVRGSVLALTECVGGAIETSLSLGLVGNSTIVNGLVKLYNSNTNVNNQTINAIQKAIDDLYSKAQTTEESSEMSKTKAGKTLSDIESETSTSASQDSGDLNSVDLERDYSGWNNAIYANNIS